MIMINIEWNSIKRKWNLDKKEIMIFKDLKKYIEKNSNKILFI